MDDADIESSAELTRFAIHFFSVLGPDDGPWMGALAYSHPSRAFIAVSSGV